MSNDALPLTVVLYRLYIATHNYRMRVELLAEERTLLLDGQGIEPPGDPGVRRADDWMRFGRGCLEQQRVGAVDKVGGGGIRHHLALEFAEELEERLLGAAGGFALELLDSCTRQARGTGEHYDEERDEKGSEDG